MKTNIPALLLLTTTLGACAVRNVPPPTVGYGEGPPSMALIEGPGVAPPANDISESYRREWLDAQRPKVETIREPERVERVIVRDREPVRYYRDDWDGPWRRDWYLPVSLSLGWWGGHGGRHGGWGWGIGWHGGPWW